MKSTLRNKTGNVMLIFATLSVGVILTTVMFQPTGINSLSSFALTSNMFGPKITTVPFDGIMNAEWCNAPVDKPLNYDNCKFREKVFRIGVHGGMTNALHFILKGALWAYQENMCFIVDEVEPKVAKMARREAPEQNVIPFLERYFEPIGASKHSEYLESALRNRNFFTPGYPQISWHEHEGRGAGLLPQDHPHRHRTRNVKPLYLKSVDNIWLKKYLIRRLLRIREEVRNISCHRLADHGLQEEYIAMSVRRGDKEIEMKILSTVDPYIEKAEAAIKSHFGGKVPTIFVASDDCAVLPELRAARSSWKFVSECDTMDVTEGGFVMTDVKFWTLKQTDDHYQKFITELIALASAKYFIGVASTNVAQFVYWMRHYDQGDDSWVFVDTVMAVV